jgi:hypothetical protein
LNGIYLLGDENGDTEEYDRHVILHEFGHFLEREITRTDSIGGPHWRGDRLDLRVAFSEGAATAFAGLVLGDPIYRDTGGTGQAGSFAFDLEAPSGSGNPAPGWFSEESIWELVYDLGDAAIDGSDLLEYAFADIWAALSGPVVTTTAVTSIFPFWNAIKAEMAEDASTLDQLAADQSIGVIVTDYGDNETNDAGSDDVLPIYTDLVVNSGTPVNVCSTDEFGGVSPSGGQNKLSSRRFLRFTPPAAGQITVSVAATSTPGDVAADPDWVIHRFGPFAFSTGAPNAACLDTGSASWTPGLCIETGEVLDVINAEYVLEVYEWTNINPIDDPEYPPIGRTCLDVTVTQP